MMAVTIANELAKREVESHICATRLEGDLKSRIDSNIGYLFLNKKHTMDLFAANRLFKYIKKNNIEIIHAHSSSYFLGFLIKIVLPKVKLIWHDHYGNSEQLVTRKKFPLSSISKSFKAILSVNNLLYEWAKVNLKPVKIYHIPNFATLKNTIPKTTILKGNLNKRIVCLANFRPQKDHINLLKAFKRVVDIHSDWSLHLVGLDFNDGYSKEIKSFIKSNTLSNHVFLYGSCLDTNFIIEQSSIGVLASKSEGLPITLLEYGLAKLPVVVTNVGDCARVITNNKNGLIVSPSNSQKLSEALIQLILNKKLRLQFGENFYAEVKSNYSKEKYIEQLISIYTLE